jgi:hypothetical protein
MYLLYRDMAAISFLLLIAVLIGFYIEEFRLPVWAAAAVFVAQYVIAALAARHSGVRSVTNVMAIHSAAPGSPQKIVATKKAQKLSLAFGFPFWLARSRAEHALRV